MRNKNVLKITYMAMLLTLIVVLSVFESTLPPMPFLPPAVRPGLANIVTMFALFFIGKKEAFSLALLKSCFVMLTRGITSGILSLSGGILSILTLIVLCSIFGNKISYILLSIFGAVMHNIGQLTAIIIILRTPATAYYLPVLLISGIIMGSVTGILLNILLPVLQYPLKKENKQ